MLGECTSHGTCLLWPQIQRFILLGLVELVKIFTLCLAYDSKHTGN